MIRKLILSVLFIENDLEVSYLINKMIDNNLEYDIRLTEANTMGGAEKYLEDRLFDVVMLDLDLPDVQGVEAVRRAYAAAPQIPLVVLTSLNDERLGSQALQEGAQDFLIKGQTETRQLMRALRYAIERKIMAEALFSEKERAQVTLNCIGDGVICTDIAGNITFLNAVAERLTGWPWGEATGRPMAEVFRIMDATSRETTPNRMELAVAQDRTVHLPANCILIRRDGMEIAIEDSASPIHDREGRNAGAVIVFHDVSVARSMALQMAHSAQHDFLTGLPNRALLNDRLGQAIAIAQRHQEKLAVLFLDLDGFKHINDSLGHPIGDKLLQSIARCLETCVRGADTVSRQGGDEFVVLLSEVQQVSDIATSATRLLRAVAEIHSIDRHDLRVTTSIGVSVYPDDGLDAETLIKHADTAMYQAKASGRQCYRFFTQAMNVRAVERQAIEEGLRRALQRHEFTLHYQPKIDLESGAITGVEALVRWIHPTRGLIAPGDFIAIAEDCGLIVPIGDWVLREACGQARAWVDAGLAVTTMAVNISAMEFRSENFLENLLAVLSETGLNPKSLVVELTEGVLMHQPEAAASTLHALRERGVQVAIDDFGTGYSSLSYLRKFPVDEIKIDQSFVRRITTHNGDAPIVTAILAMARSLRLRVVAEGVETAEEQAFLRSHECGEAQGYYFSRPVPPEQLATLLRTGIPDPGVASSVVAAAGRLFPRGERPFDTDDGLHSCQGSITGTRVSS
jgi:diguanylate cyclase (GGDEF)-like protein/PAS domain S-box-containing protein